MHQDQGFIRSCLCCPCKLEHREHHGDREVTERPGSLLLLLGQMLPKLSACRMTIKGRYPNALLANTGRITAGGEGMQEKQMRESRKCVAWHEHLTCREGELHLLLHDLQGNEVVFLVKPAIVEQEGVPLLCSKPARNQGSVSLTAHEKAELRSQSRGQVHRRPAGTAARADRQGHGSRERKMGGKGHMRGGDAAGWVTDVRSGHRSDPGWREYRSQRPGSTGQDIRKRCLHTQMPIALARGKCFLFLLPPPALAEAPEAPVCQ